MTDRMFPLQANRSRDAQPGPLQIPWSIAEKAYGVYASLYGRDQTLECLARRGGFGVSEMDTLYPEWRKEVDEIELLQAEVVRLRECLSSIANLPAVWVSHADVSNVLLRAKEIAAKAVEDKP